MLRHWLSWRRPWWSWTTIPAPGHWSGYSTADGFAVVGDAGDRPGAVAVARWLRRDIGLLDILMSGRDGFWVARPFLAAASPPVVVLISRRSADDDGDAIERCRGVDGSLPKADLGGASLGQLIDSL